MAQYDFHALLDPFEYQKLICGVLQVRENVQLEMYKEGRDQGMDGSFHSVDGRVVVQAKRYRTDFSALMRLLRESELPKVKKLQPARYILAISMDFTPQQKEKIQELFEGYIHSTADIISQADINLLFEDQRYENVQMAHPKLWQASFQVMKLAFSQAMHAGYYSEIKYELREAVNQAAMYVPTRIYRKAIEGWGSKKVLLITGVPGVGKTSMARVLALSYLQQARENENWAAGYVWVHNVQEIYDHWDDAPRTVFILDDFWGSIFREERTGQEENRLIKLIRRISEGDEEKRLILTTREYILQQGYEQHHGLKETLERSACICSMNGYNEDERAAILYRHLYASGLDYPYVAYLYENSRKVVFHENYDPRILAQFLQYEKPQGHPAEYLEQLFAYFDSPMDFWEDIFNRLSPDAQTVAMLLMISSPPIGYEELQCCYRKYTAQCAGERKTKALGECIAELEKTLIVTHRDQQERCITVGLRLPSVEDYLYAKLRKHAPFYMQLLTGVCCYYNQLVFLYRHLAKDCTREAVDALVDKLQQGYWCWMDSFYVYGQTDGYLPDYDLVFENKGVMERLNYLINLYREVKNERLKAYIEKLAREFGSLINRIDDECLYYDLWNFPVYLANMKKLGLALPDGAVVRQLFDAAFSLNHFIQLEALQEIYPAEFASIKPAYEEMLTAERDEIVLNEISLLLDYEMETELDLLLDSIENIYAQKGWPFTGALQKQIEAMTGFDALDEGQHYISPLLEPAAQQQERSFEQVKAESRWILGPRETPLQDEERHAQICAAFPAKAAQDILQDMARGGYAGALLQTQSDIDFYSRCFAREEGKVLPDSEVEFLSDALQAACAHDKALAGELAHLLAACFSFVLYQERPVIRSKAFDSAQDVQQHLKNERRREIFERDFVLRSDQWIILKHVPVYIMAFAMVTATSRWMEKENSLRYEEIFSYSDPIYRMTHEDGTLDLYTTEIGSYRFNNTDWQMRLYRMYEAVDTGHFNCEYAAPLLKDLLKGIGDGTADEKMAALVKQMDLQVMIDEQGYVVSIMTCVWEEMLLAESLGIMENLSCRQEPLPSALVACLQAEGFLEKEKQTDLLRCKLSNVHNREWLEQLIDCDVLRRNIIALERVVQRFDDGNFDCVARENM